MPAYSGSQENSKNICHFKQQYISFGVSAQALSLSGKWENCIPSASVSISLQQLQLDLWSFLSELQACDSSS